MPETRSPVLLGFWYSLLVGFVGTPANAADPAGDEFFEKQVRPLLVKRCYQCHSGTKAGGGLSLETAAGWRKGGESGPAIVPRQPEESLLVDAIRYRSLEMPPPKSGGKLPPAEIQILTKWVAMGAPDPRVAVSQTGRMSSEAAKSWWSFQPLPKVPGLAKPEQIDTFLNSALRENSLRPVGPADKRTLIRRATYDLTGLPPTPTEVDAFLSDDSVQAFEKVIDRLLASPQYGVRWGRHWLDVVRYADTAGENTDRPLPHIWRYRNWVLDAINRDMPFDEFTRLQIAGDILRKDGSSDAFAEGIIATGYLAVARRFGHDIDKDIHLTYEDVIDNLGQNFLGLTLGCARCHDHKYDPVTAADYYALYGIFQSTRFSFPGCEPKGQPRDLVPLANSTEMKKRQAEYQQRLKEYDAKYVSPKKETQRLKQLATNSVRVLATGTVAEGKSLSLNHKRNGKLNQVTLHKGEVLQLTVLRNGNHGADTTRVEWNIQRLSDQKSWSVADVIPRLIEGGPLVTQNGATWCFLDVTDGPTFLRQKKTHISEKDGLNAWANGDTPSVLVNATMQPVNVWTKLPAYAFFVHPGPQEDVAVAWVCPADGNYSIQGTVSDAHPAPGLDGVSFRLEQYADAKLGSGLIALGNLPSSRPPRPEAPTPSMAYAVVESNPVDVRLHQRGDPEQPGERIPRRWLSMFGGTPVSSGSGREELADWIVKHPLFARVITNRIWQGHFGRGLVVTPNDFGYRGTPPTHPELLDWLAAQLRSNDYRLKPMHKLIMLSDAYQRSSIPQQNQTELHPENRWFSHFPRRRLTAEELRDSLLLVSGKLDESFGEQHPFPPTASWSFTQHNPFNAVYHHDRRSVFLMTQRQRRHPYLALFDGADPNSSTPARQSTTVPTQALYFLNAPFFHQQAETLMKTLPSENDTVRTAFLFRRIFQRTPTQQETELASQFLNNYPGQPNDKWEAYIRVLLASNEFLYVD